MDITEYTICQHFLPALINGDESGLEQEDVDALAAWMAREEFDLRVGHFDTDSDEESSFALCDVTGLRGDTVTLRWVAMREAPRGSV